MDPDATAAEYIHAQEEALAKRTMAPTPLLLIISV